jgi:integrase
MGMRQIKKDTWRLDVSIWFESSESRRRETFTGGKKAAEDRFREIKAELRKKAESIQRSLKNIDTFGQALDNYYRFKGDDHLVSKTSFFKMREDLGAVSMGEIQQRFKDYWLNLQKTRSCQTGDFLAPSTVNHYTVMAKAALNMCLKDGLISSNPLAYIPILKVVPRDVTLSDIDKQRFLNVVDKEAPHLSAIVRFALAVPCRKMELVNLRCEDLDLINGAVRVRHENAKGDNGSWKPIPPDLIDYFRNLPSETEYLFYRVVKKKPVCLGNFRRAFVRCLRLAEIEDWHFHDFRHEAATDLLNAGNPEQVVCQIAGWKSGNMIRQYYHKDGLRAVRQVVFPGQKSDTITRHLQVQKS